MPGPATEGGQAPGGGDLVGVVAGAGRHDEGEVAFEPHALGDRRDGGEAELEVGEEVPFAVTIALNEPATDHTRIAATYPPETPDTVTVQGASELPY